MVQGTSGEDMTTQIYQEVSKMSMDGIIDQDSYVDLIENIGKFDYRIREEQIPGYNSRLF